MKHIPERLLFTAIALVWVPVILICGIISGFIGGLTDVIRTIRIYWKGNVIPDYWRKFKGYGRNYRWDMVDREERKNVI